MLCVATAGLAVAVYAIGRLGARTVECLRHCLQGTAKTTDEVGRERILDAQKLFTQNMEISLDLLRTAPELNPNKDYYAFRCSRSVDSDGSGQQDCYGGDEFARDRFRVWRLGKEDPVILAITPSLGASIIACPATFQVDGEDVPVVQLLFHSYSLRGPVTLAGPVLEENRRRIQALIA
ncbi:MAG: hypothetical protein HYZ48_02790 [Chlamydiales bacterium]|nr:hypothetical protein [Chlamydiales bacterium]